MHDMVRFVIQKLGLLIHDLYMDSTIMHRSMLKITDMHHIKLNPPPAPGILSKISLLISKSINK